MRFTRDWWQKIFFIVLLCLAIGMTFSACGGAASNCEAVVNVGSCNSTNTNNAP